MGLEADAIGATIVTLLMVSAAPKKLGLVSASQCEYQFGRFHHPGFCKPDASFTRAGRLPKGGAAKTRTKHVPDLVVEVISPNDLAEEVFVKVRKYLESRVSLVWIISPASRAVQVYRADGTGAFLTADAILEAGELLPDFRCTVAQLFEQADLYVQP